MRVLSIILTISCLLTTTVFLKSGHADCTLDASPTSGSAPLAVHFTTADLSNGVSFQSITLDPGDGADDISLIIPVTDYVYQKAGSYTATLTAEETAGEVHVCEVTVEVDESLQLKPELTASSGPEPSDFTFNVALTDGTSPYTYTFDFGDGSQPVLSDTETKTYTYQDGGDYSVKVTVTDADGNTGDATTAVTVPFSCSLEANPASGAAPLDVHFTTTGLPEGVAFQSIALDPGDGSAPLSLVLPITDYTYQNTGTYDAMLTATESAGPVYACKAAITVSEKDTASDVIKLTPKLTVVPGAQEMAYAFSITVPNGRAPYAYLFDFGDGSEPVQATTETQEHTYRNEGAYMVKVSVTDDAGNAGETTYNLSVGGPLTLYLTSDVERGIAPVTVSFSPKVKGGITPYTYAWDFGDETTGTEAAPVHEYTQMGNYACRLTVTDARGTTIKAPLQISVVSLINISVIPKRVTLYYPGAKAHIKVQGHMSDGTLLKPSPLTMEVLDTDIATLDGSVIEAVAEGNTQIMVSSGDITGTANLTVNFMPVSIEVEDFFVSLRTEETYTPVVHAIYENGSRNEVTDIEVGIHRGEGVIQVEGSTVTAVSDGIAIIEISHKGRGATTLVEVTGALPLNITPQKIRIKPGKMASIQIAGGDPPYTVSRGDLDEKGFHWQVTMPEIPGDYVYKAMDSKNKSVSLEVTVLSPLKIRKTGENMDAQPRTIDLTAFGGAPPYQWVATAGSLSATETADDTIPTTYTLPQLPGTYTLTVTDTSGQAADYWVTTYADMLVSPKKLYMAPETEHLIRVVGGVPPYRAIIEAGSVTDQTLDANPDTPDPGFLFKAPDIVGEYTVTIKDQRNTDRTVTVHVDHPLWVTPQKVYMDRNETREFQILGGIGKDAEITLQALVGEVPAHPENRTFDYTSPDVTGLDKIIVTDNSGQDVTVIVQVTSDYYFVTPSKEALLKGETRLFRTVGGVGEERIWAATYGEIAKDADNPKAALYTAQDQLVQDQLSVKDLEDQSVTADIHVISDRVMLTPREVFLGPNERATFRALMGTETYEFIATDGKMVPSESDENGQFSKIIYTAPARVGEYFVRVFDTAGNVAKSRVTVSGGHVKPRPVAPAIKEILFPDIDPNSFDQPVAVGDIQIGGTHMKLATDFPNYEKDDGSPMPMSYYLLMQLTDVNMWFVFTMEGEILLPSQLRPFATNVTDMVYASVFEFDLCMPDIPLAIDIYALAIASEYDPHGALAFEPADAPYEMWHLQFQVQKCKE